MISLCGIIQIRSGILPTTDVQAEQLNKVLNALPYELVSQKKIEVVDKHRRADVLCWGMILATLKSGKEVTKLAFDKYNQILSTARIRLNNKQAMLVRNLPMEKFLELYKDSNYEIIVGHAYRLGQICLRRDRTVNMNKFNHLKEMEEKSKMVLMKDASNIVAKKIVDPMVYLDELEKKIEIRMAEVKKEHVEVIKALIKNEDEYEKIRPARALSEIFGPQANVSELCLKGGTPPNKRKRLDKKRRGRGGSKKKKRGRNNHTLHMTRPGQYAPDIYEAELMFVDTASYRTVSSGDAMNWCYRTSAYDPDPSVLTGSIPGFVELANLYGYYRVISIKALVNIGNFETNQCVVVVWPSNVQNNVNSLTKDDLIEVSGNPYARTYMVGNNNARPLIVRTVLNPKQFIGPTYYTDESYAATTSGNPSNMLYMNIGVYRTYTDFANNVATLVKLIYKVRFYGRRQLFSSFVREPMTKDDDAGDDGKDLGQGDVDFDKLGLGVDKDTFMNALKVLGDKISG